jgi:hypothetical protein
VKNDRRFDRRFSPTPESGDIIGGTGGPGGGLRADADADASSSGPMGTGDGFRELLGEGEGRGCVWPRVNLACSLLSRLFLKSPEKLAGKAPFRAPRPAVRDVLAPIAGSASSPQPTVLPVALPTASAGTDVAMPFGCEFGPVDCFEGPRGRLPKGRSSQSLSWKNTRMMLYSLISIQLFRAASRRSCVPLSRERYENARLTTSRSTSESSIS